MQDNMLTGYSKRLSKKLGEMLPVSLKQKIQHFANIQRCSDVVSWLRLVKSRQNRFIDNTRNSYSCTIKMNILHYFRNFDSAVHVSIL